MMLLSLQASACFSRRRTPLLVAVAVLSNGVAQYDQESAAVSDMLPGRLVNTVLEPFKPYHIKVDVGEVKYVRFRCGSRPADVVISLASYSSNDDPILLMSMGLKESPSLLKHDASSFIHWREDSMGGHFVVAKAVGPEGGIIGLLNTKHFAAEQLNGILSLRCSTIIAFDLLFWDFLRDSYVCPVGDAPAAPENHFCSGHGQCDKHGKCLCDPMFAGPACEYKQNHITVTSFGHYDVDVPTGGYHYFRVRVPHKFPGGYLEVKLLASTPLVLLVSRMGIPTKSFYEMSNFDDWVSGHRWSRMKFQVQPDPSLPAQPGGTIFRPFNTTQTHRRALNDALCPKLPRLRQDGPVCLSVDYQKCEGSCTLCIACNKRSAGDGACSSACNHCRSVHCLELLSACGQNASCSLEAARGGEAAECETMCGGCMACMDSSDENCKDCPHCCRLCLPVAAKCDLLRVPQLDAESRFVTVGVFHHRGRNKTAKIMANAKLDIILKTDRGFGSKFQPRDMLSYLYDPFHDIRNLAVTQRHVYPDGMRFFYTVKLENKPTKVWVQLFSKRMTLIRVDHFGADKEGFADSGTQLSFEGGSNISHVLTSSWRSPKTLFDFDQVYTQPADGHMRIRVIGRRTLWCAIFAKVDGHLVVTVQPFDPGFHTPSLSWSIACVFGLLAAMLAMFFLGRGRLKEDDCINSGRASTQPADRFSNLVRTDSIEEEYHQRVALTVPPGGSAVDSSHGCHADARLDPCVEEQYLLRGGIGDEGL